MKSTRWFRKAAERPAFQVSPVCDHFLEQRKVTTLEHATDYMLAEELVRRGHVRVNAEQDQNTTIRLCGAISAIIVYD